MANRKKYIQSIIESIHRTKQQVHCKLSHTTETTITPTEWTTLSIIADNDHISSKELAGKMGVSTSAVSQIIKKLHNAKYLKKTQNKRDKRFALLQTTAKAQKLLSKLNENTQHDMDGLFQPLTNNELKTLAQLHAKIVDSLNK